MFKAQETWKPDICIYHGNCNDGFGAAWAVWKRWGDNVVYVPAAYGKPLQIDTVGKNVLFVDFSLKYDEMHNLLQDPARTPASVIVLDHHKTAEAELAPYICACDVKTALADVATWLDILPVIAIFDMKKSGARLAWEFCYSAEPIPLLLEYIEDRDLWKFIFPGTREIHTWLSSYPQNFALWVELVNRVTTDNSVFKEGAALLRSHNKRVSDMCEFVGMQYIGGHPVPCVNAPFFLASDLGNKLLQLHPAAKFAATYYIINDFAHYSLRSTDDRIDVSEIAKNYGGGGHRNAAGFKITLGAALPFKPYS